mgnify:CR=1 FL=1
MDAVRNPFAPGAGSRPPELAGRDEIVFEVAQKLTAEVGEDGIIKVS